MAPKILKTTERTDRPKAYDVQSTGGFSKRIIALLCFGVIIAGVAGYHLMISSAPKAQKRPPSVTIPLVTIRKIYPQAQQVVVNAMGTVAPAKELTLKSRVSGEVVRTHSEFTEGGIVSKGEQIILIDDVDYKLDVAQKQSAVTDADYALKLELGRQDVAQREWQLLNGDRPAPEKDRELALRKPQLKKAQSDLKAARAQYEAVRLQLSRTKISTPFDAVIRTVHVELGSQVTQQETLATLVGTREYRIRVSVPIDRLKWIDIPGVRKMRGAQVLITYHGNVVRTGTVIKLLSDLEEEGRMARLIVVVKDPLGMTSENADKPAMLIGEYVRVEIQGRKVPDAYRIPRTALRDNAHIWLMDENGKLEIRHVRPLWRDAKAVLVKDDLKPGARLIVSDLPVPVEGMTVQVDSNGKKNKTSVATSGEE